MTISLRVLFVFKWSARLLTFCIACTDGFERCPQGCNPGITEKVGQHNSNCRARARQKYAKAEMAKQCAESAQRQPSGYCILCMSSVLPFLPSPPPVCPLPSTLHIQNQWKVSMLSPLYNLSRSLVVSLSRSCWFFKTEKFARHPCPLLCEIEPYRFQFRLYIEP